MFGSPGNLQTEQDLLEFGERVAMKLDDENVVFDAAMIYWWYTRKET
jgi:hypothetical protein